MRLARMAARGMEIVADEKNKKRRHSNGDTLRALAYFSQVGITMAATIIVGVLLGKYLDRWLGTDPWLLLICSLLGAGASFKSLSRVF